MAKTPDTPKKPGRSPKSKAHRPDVQPIGPALAELLNPAINRGESGIGSSTGLKPPPDNSWDRRAGGEAAAHRARASTKGKSAEVATGDASARPMPLRPNPQPVGARSASTNIPSRGFPPPNPLRASEARLDPQAGEGSIRQAPRAGASDDSEAAPLASPPPLA